jgi:homoserine dehydrogenase
MIPAGSIMARVNGPDNAVMVIGEKMGATMSFGPGAGGDATGAAVVSDVLALGQPARHVTAGICEFEEIRELPIVPITDTCHEYYLSLSCLDKPGSLAVISDILKKHEISVELVYQLERSPGNPVKVDIVIHETFEGQLLSAVSEINNLPAVNENIKWIRIQNLDK